MKYFFGVISLLFLFTSTHANTLLDIEFGGHKMKIIEYYTNDRDFEIKIGVDKKGGSSVLEIARDLGALSGINGVFECPKDYTECGGKNFTINERYIQGEKIGPYDSTGARVVFGWDKNISPFLFQTDTINSLKESEIWEGFANFPLLLKDGEDQIENYVDLGLVDKKMTGKARRSFICSTQEGDKIYFGHVYNIGVDWMALLLKDFGCHNAINLDAGFSTAFVYNGKYIAGPGREILDGVFIVPKNINTESIEVRIDNIMTAIRKYLQNKNNSQQINFKNKLSAGLNKISDKIYTRHSVPYIIDNEIIGEKTDIRNISTLKKLYLINRLRDEVSGL